MQLSTHFSLDELIASDYAARHGIDNTPTPPVVEALRRTALGLEQVRQALDGASVRVSSGYRCLALNRALGSKDSSQHRLGEAADFTAPGFGTPDQIVKRLRVSGIRFDQLILEFGRWVHVSFSDRCRGECLVIDGAGTRVLA